MRTFALCPFLLAFVFPMTSALADGGDELPGPTGLGPASIPIASGTGIVTAGVGLFGGVGTQASGNIAFNVPAGASVEQVILYWEGRIQSPVINDPTSIVVDGNTVTGALINVPRFHFRSGLPEHAFVTYREDITGLNLVGAGANNLFISPALGDDPYADYHTNGAGVLVIFDDGSGTAAIDVRDGSDFAFLPLPETVDNSCVAQTFNFPSAAVDRTADLALFACDVQDPAKRFRPNAVEVTVGGVTTTFDDPFLSVDGLHWDTFTPSILIPAGVGSLTVNVFPVAATGSDPPGSLAASLLWLAAALSVPPPLMEPPLCRVTGGGNDCADAMFIADPTNGEDCSMAQGQTKKVRGQFDAYTFGGQCGAPGSIFGEWTHVNHSGPAGQWTFHAGTNSAPDDTSFAVDACFDDPACVHAAANGFVKQIECHGVGTFKNIKTLPDDPNNLMKNAIPGVTLHAVWAHLVDSGEPGKNGRPGNSNRCDPLFGDDLASCDCPDFYDITIHAGPTPASDVIYRVFGFLRGGNFQMHDAK